MSSSISPYDDDTDNEECPVTAFDGPVMLDPLGKIAQAINKAANRRSRKREGERKRVEKLERKMKRDQKRALKELKHLDKAAKMTKVPSAPPKTSHEPKFHRRNFSEDTYYNMAKQGCFETIPVRFILKRLRECVQLRVDEVVRQKILEYQNSDTQQYIIQFVHQEFATMHQNVYELASIVRATLQDHVPPALPYQLQPQEERDEPSQLPSLFTSKEYLETLETEDSF